MYERAENCDGTLFVTLTVVRFLLYWLSPFGVYVMNPNLLLGFNDGAFRTWLTETENRVPDEIAAAGSVMTTRLPLIVHTKRALVPTSVHWPLVPGTISDGNMIYSLDDTAIGDIWLSWNV